MQTQCAWNGRLSGGCGSWVQADQIAHKAVFPHGLALPGGRRHAALLRLPGVYRGIPQQAVGFHGYRRIFNHHLAAQHKHFEFLHKLPQKVSPAQQPIGRTGLLLAFANQHKTGQHAALGIAPGCQPGAMNRQQGYVLGQLVVQECGGVCSMDAHHCPVAELVGMFTHQADHAIACVK